MQTEEIERINEIKPKQLERFKFVKEFHMKEDNGNIIILYSNHLSFRLLKDFYLNLPNRLILLFSHFI